MNSLKDLLANNRRWAAGVTAQEPHFFENLSQQQAPKYLWIGCSDSRVPATQIVDLPPGEIFVHRNVANVVVHTDLNALSTIQFAVDVLKVKHILVVGHYGCGGVGAVLARTRLGLIDNWLKHIDDVAMKHAGKLDPALAMAVRHARLCELNAIEQAVNVCHTTVVRDAWDRGQPLAVHAWIYGLDNGHIHDLGLDVRGNEHLPEAYRQALAGLAERWQVAGQEVSLP